MKNRFARRDENQERISISGKVITNDEIIQKLNDLLKDDSERWSFILLKNDEETYEEICNSIKNFDKNGTKLLSNIPPFFSTDAPPIMF